MISPLSLEIRSRQSGRLQRKFIIWQHIKTCMMSRQSTPCKERVLGSECYVKKRVKKCVVSHKMFEAQIMFSSKSGLGKFPMQAFDSLLFFPFNNIHPVSLSY